MNNAEAVRLMFADTAPLRSVLVVGCGPDREPEWAENGFVPIFQDIEPRNNPDILCNMCELPEHVGPYDAIFASHCIEHLYPHEVYKALCGFRRVLKPGGLFVMLVPDLEDVKPNTELLYRTDEGPICGLQLYYGNFRQIPEFPHMAHHCGFTKETIIQALKGAGFDECRAERLPWFNLMGVGAKKISKPKTADEKLADEICGVKN